MQRVSNNFDVKKGKFLNSINYKYLPGCIKEKYVAPMVTSNIKTSSDFLFSWALPLIDKDRFYFRVRGIHLNPFFSVCRYVGECKISNWIFNDYNLLV